MLKCLIHRIAATWLRMAHRLNQAFGKSIKLIAKLQFFEIQDLLPVRLLVLLLVPKWVPERNELIHYEADGPYINRLAIYVVTCNLFRCLVDQGTAIIIETLASLVLHRETKVD